MLVGDSLSITVYACRRFASPSRIPHNGGRSSKKLSHNGDEQKEVFLEIFNYEDITRMFQIFPAEKGISEEECGRRKRALWDATIDKWCRAPGTVVFIQDGSATAKGFGGATQVCHFVPGKKEAVTLGTFSERAMDGVKSNACIEEGAIDRKGTEAMLDDGFFEDCEKKMGCKIKHVERLQDNDGIGWRNKDRNTLWQDSKVAQLNARRLGGYVPVTPDRPQLWGMRISLAHTP